MTSETLTHCTLCHSEHIIDHLQLKDHFVSGEIFSLSECSDCGFVFTNPRPVPSEAGRYYESEDYISHSRTSRGLVNRLFHLARIYTLAHKKKIVSKYSPGLKLLDYGCGTGDFLEHMEKSGWACFGIEPNAQALQTADAKKGMMITGEEGLKGFKPASLDAITLWHVLEHVYPLKKRIQSFHRILGQGGTLFVAVPNRLSYDASKYGPFWAAYDVPRHIHHFTPSTIKKLMEDHGFSLVSTRAMFLDAFYIAMLSEKYEHGKNRYLNALMSGCRSNFNALMNDHNYSSLIYIFKKS